MKRLSLLLLPVILILTSSACEQRGGPSANQRKKQQITVRKYVPQSPEMARPASDGTGAETATYWYERKLIRTAGLLVQVEDVTAALEGAWQIAGAHSGLPSDSRTTGSEEGGRRGELTIRVPSSGFEALLTDLKNLGDVQEEMVATQDVTGEYTDLKTRLNVKRRTEQRLLKILQDRTGDLADVLKVERELERVVVAIERMEAARRLYDRQIALATINLELFEPQAEAGTSHWTPIAGAFDRSLEVLMVSFSALTYVVVFLVPWLVLATMIWLLTRFIMRNFRPQIQRLTPDETVD